jgi:hypothetical protein
MSAALSHQRRWAAVFVGLLAVIVVLVVLWLAHPNGSNTSTAAACTVVTGALADGPDPSVDPTGYAEAQVLPLREVTTSNVELHSALLALSNAYEQLFKVGDTKSAERAVAAATAEVETFCPDVAS